MSYNTELQNNNEELQEILNAVNELPEAGESVTDAVRYTAQILTDAQKAQARENIAALGESDLQGAVNDALSQAKASGEFDGKDGADGNDYVLTDADKADIVADVIAAIGAPIAGTIDENKVITLGGELAEGRYTLRWITKDGYAQICTLTVDGNGEITPPDTPDTPDEPVAPDTTLVWEKGTKIDRSTGNETTGQTVYSASNYIEIVDGYAYTMAKNNDRSANFSVVYYDENKNFISTSSDAHAQSTERYTVAVPLIATASYFRIRLYDTVSQLADSGDWVLTAEVSA